MKSVSQMLRFLVIFVAIIGGISLGTIYLWWRFVSAPVNPSISLPSLVVIPQGASAADVGKILVDKGIIKDPFVFRLVAQFKGQADKIYPGAYKLSPDQSLLDVLGQLLVGPSDIRVTIPEGFRREQIALRLQNNLGTQDKDFDFKEFLNPTRNLEGQLFPDTYFIPQDATAQSVVTMMTDNFNKQTAGLSLTPQTIILASIIERETKDTPGERPIVAGILIKRLKGGWPIQADATLQYARDSRAILASIPGGYRFWEPITAGDKNLDTPFNTYLNKGLPPAPIANPGLSAIKAVLNPQDSPYWYYLHGSDGTIHFATTLDQQQANIAKYL